MAQTAMQQESEFHPWGISLDNNQALGDPEVILRCIVSGFFANAARLHHSGAYRTLRDDHELHIHPTSVLYAEKPPKWVVYNEVMQTSRHFLRDVSAIESSWLVELAPHFYRRGTVRTATLLLFFIFL
ncbi:DHX35 helicase, partial [Polyodon spathula]|nr:DHX35 helicase [Polyodon spathula]